MTSRGRDTTGKSQPSLPVVKEDLTRSEATELLAESSPFVQVGDDTRNPVGKTPQVRLVKVGFDFGGSGENRVGLQALPFPSRESLQLSKAGPGTRTTRMDKEKQREVLAGTQKARPAWWRLGLLPSLPLVKEKRNETGQD